MNYPKVKTWTGGEGTAEMLDLGPSLGKCSTITEQKVKPKNEIKIGGTAMKTTGICKWFNETKGFGYVTGPDGDCFVHQSELQMDGFRTLVEGQTVTYDMEQSPRGPRAVNVFVIYEG